MDFKTRLRNIMLETNITQAELSRRLGVAKSAVHKWEYGITYPKKKTLIELSKIFNCSTDYLMGNSDVRYPIKKEMIDGTDVVYIGDLNDEDKNFIKNFIETYKKSKKGE